MSYRFNASMPFFQGHLLKKYFPKCVHPERELAAAAEGRGRGPGPARARPGPGPTRAGPVRARPGQGPGRAWAHGRGLRPRP